MIEIRPTNDKYELSQLYSASKCALTNTSKAVVARDGNEVLGSCLFDMFSDKIIVNDVSPLDDILLADGILRSALHVAVENGIFTAFYSDSAPIKLFSELNFIKNAEKKELNLEKLFSSCQSCKND